jgi:protein gp37
MTSRDTHISWTDSSWNPTTGCTAISPGCEHCYAKAMTDRLFGGDFATLKLHHDRLREGDTFRPILESGALRPRMVFVNSMSDLMHRDIPDTFRDRVFDVIDSAAATVFQVLTKRHVTLRRYVAARYHDRGVPPHLWLGVSVEDSPRGIRLEELRRLKAEVGPFTAFASVEPLLAALDRVSFVGIDQVLVGGESGPQARHCHAEHMRQALALAGEAGAARWLKQWGTWLSNPLYAASTARRHIDRVRDAIGAGERMAQIVTGKDGKPRVTGEKGGATLDGETYRELPPAYAALTARLHPLLIR